MRYFDAHCHVQFDAYDADRAQVFEAMRSTEVGGILVGTDSTTSRLAVEYADGKTVFASVGLHPNDKPQEGYDDAYYAALAKDTKVVAIGECGLDYYRAQQARTESPDSGMAKQAMGASSAYFRPENPEAEKARQKDVFARHIELAASLDKPLMIHARPSKGSMDAYLEAYDMLKEAKMKHGDRLRGNMHFYVGDIETTKLFLSLGFTFSYTAVLTFTHDYDEVVRFIPLEHLLSETDAPYVAPAPNRGKRNDPLAVRSVVSAIASIRGEDEETVREALLGNAKRVFRLP
jgi:TatD DNase family protein